jgi:outer membrane protein OmpA-like peptidoglycan-associated protein/curli biogenesis system outer membrane secretion channel CsgG
LSALAAFLLCGVVVADVEETLTYQGNKARITVGNIKDKADGCSWEEAEAVGEMLSTALANDPKFIVLASGEEVDELIDEIDFGQSGYVEEGRGPEKGLMEGADILVTGAVTAFEPDAGGGGGFLGGLKDKAAGKVGVKSKKAKMQIDIKIIDIRTRRILKAKTVKAESKNWKVDMFGGGIVNDVALAGGLGAYSNEPMETAVRAALAKTLELISKEVPEEYYRYKGGGQYSQDYGATGQQGATGQTAGSAGQAGAGEATAAAATTTQPSGPVAEDMKLYTKYDFIPGDKVIFFDDMSNEEEGEFPFRWNLDRGVFEIVRLGSEYWIMCTDDGYIRPRMADAPLPETYTVEMDFYSPGNEKTMGYYYIFWMDADGEELGKFEVYSNRTTNLQIGGKQLSSKDLPSDLTKGSHTMRIMATSRSIKCFIDNVRVANVPKVENFSPVNFKVRVYPYNDPDNLALIRNFRFAEGGKSFRDQMDMTGRVVTHGILFDSGKHIIKAESSKTLKKIGDMLSDDAALRICIEGHTDSDGADDANLDLSNRRAESVRSYLVSNYGIAADRLECKGLGESKPIDTNDSPEGKANNRRVELVKL